MIRFAPMSDSDFQMFLRKAIPEYAYDQTRAGNWPADEGMARARQEFQQLLVEGPHTPGHYFMNILDDDQQVGMIWWSVVNTSPAWRVAFLTDFFIFSEFRGMALELPALALFESQVRSLGVNRIELQIFSHKTDERDLYRRAGYEDVSIFIAKNLSPAA